MTDIWLVEHVGVTIGKNKIYRYTLSNKFTGEMVTAHVSPGYDDPQMCHLIKGDKIKATLTGGNYSNPKIGKHIQSKGFKIL